MKPRRLVSALCILLLAAAIGAAARPPEWILAERLLEACQAGDAAAVDKYLKLGISPNVRDKFGLPALHRALRADPRKDDTKEIAVLKLLIAAGADINAVNDFGSNAFFMTSGPNSYEKTSKYPVYEFLISAGVNTRRDLCGRNREERSDPCPGESEDAAIWRHFLEGSLNFSADGLAKVGPYKNSAAFVMGAAYYGDSNLLPLELNTLLLPVPPTDANGETQLFYRAPRRRFDSGDTSEFPPGLVGVRSKTGETALIRAARFDNDFFVVRLLRAKADPAARDKSGLNALDYAATYDYYLTVLALLAKSDPNAPAPDGAPPLLRAVRTRSGSAVAAFAFAKLASERLAAQARRSRSDSDAKLAAAYARVDVNQSDRDGVTPLIAAVEAGDADIVGTLMRLKPNLEMKDRKGRTAVTIAKGLKDSRIRELLSAVSR